ncbi:MAG TPA: Rrf2 family transcriptional regulator [Elusimicrobiales bacterium]|nr:Rrf2 family transcriptional regulator [Elusimicrobiales bacterium]
MKLLNREVDYAVRALVLMARANKPSVSAAQMQAEAGVNRPFLRKILQKLHKAGILQASKGKGGGFSPAKTPENIRLSELIAALQGPLKLNDCFFRKKLCGNHATCLLRRRLGEVEARLTEEMERITIKDLL